MLANQPTNGYGGLREGQSNTPTAQSEKSWFKSAVLVLLLGILGVGVALLVMVARQNNEEEANWKEFSEYKLQFAKSYSSSEEESNRFAAFIQNKLEISRLNNLESGATFGWTKFSDLTSEEFAEQFLTFRPEENLESRPNWRVAESSGQLRSSDGIDWADEGVSTPVRDQGYCGSCWAFSAVGAVEGAYVKASWDGSAYTVNPENLRLSEQEIVSCETTMWGCGGGDLEPAFDYIKDAGGLSSEDDYPYSDKSYSKGETGQCDNSQKNPVSGTEVDEVVYATEPCTSSRCNDVDESTLQESLEDNGPIAVCVNASYWSNYEEGIMTADECGRNGYYALNHCVVLDGWGTSDDGTKYWKVKNSWATDWGEDGYIYLAMGENACGIADEAIYVTLQ